jgi:rare lipoprotein A
MRKKQMSLPGARIALLVPILALAAAGCGGLPRRPAGQVWREEGLASWYGRDFDGRRTASGERYNMYSMTAAHKTLPLGTEVTVTHRVTGRRIRVRVNDRGPFVAGRVIDLSYGAARKLGSADAGVAPVLLEAELPASAFAAATAAAPAPVAPPPAPAPALPGPAAAPAPPVPDVPPAPLPAPPLPAPLPQAPPATARPAAAAAVSAPAAPPLRGVFSVQVGAFGVEENARRLAQGLQQSVGHATVVRFDDNRGTWWRVRAGRYETEDEARRAAAAFEARGLAGFVVRED